MPKSEQLPSVSPELQAKIEECDPDVQAFVIALNEENKRLNKRNASLEATNASLTNNAKEIKKHFAPGTMSDEELKEDIVPFLMGEVRDAGGWQVYCTKHGFNPDTLLINHGVD